MLYWCWSHLCRRAYVSILFAVNTYLLTNVKAQIAMYGLTKPPRSASEASKEKKSLRTLERWRIPNTVKPKGARLTRSQPRLGTLISKRNLSVPLSASGLATGCRAGQRSRMRLQKPTSWMKKNSHVLNNRAFPELQRHTGPCLNKLTSTISYGILEQIGKPSLRP